MKKFLIVVLSLYSILFGTVYIIKESGIIPKDPEKQMPLMAQDTTKVVDHSKFDVLKKNFNSPQEVTAACISCHTERGQEVLHSSHFQWAREEYIPGKGIQRIGKKNVFNNFCIGTVSNEAMCTMCHAGYGNTGEDFDFTDETNIDCLACHDNTGIYAKTGGAGLPAPDLKLDSIAQHVGKPKMANCGSCHFFSGGGNNVKHGDLESALASSDKEVDVHMGYDGVKMECIACHTADHHNIKGQLYAVSSMNKDRASCTDCHSQSAHKSDMLNEHTIKVSCQTCHIPEYAKVNATKMEWDWSTAGKLKNGEPYDVEDSMGNHIYKSIKGSFKFATHVKPDYVWFNGTASHYLLGDTIDPSGVTEINTLFGSYNDKDSKIIPVKIHYGKQIYDSIQNILIQPKLFAKNKGEGGFWKDFDWDSAAYYGMQAAHMKYSGKYGFAKTKMYWPINHMVSPKEKALSCVECHSDNGRLAGLPGFYMPARDSNNFVEFAGKWLIILSIFGIAMHASIRIFFNRRHKKKIQ